MKVFYLIPQYVKGFSKSSRWQTISRGYTLRHPDFQLQSVAVLEESGHKVKFCDATAERIEKKQVFEKIKKFNPDMLVVYCTTPSIYDDISYIQEFKKKYPDAISVVIGAHVSVEWEDTLKIAGPSLDVVVIGEYDYSLRDLANKVSLEKCKGIVYQKNKKIKINTPRPPVPINELPFPAWYHIKPEDYPDPGKLNPFITIIGSRGCVGRCAFCLMTNTLYKTLRLKDPKKICDEIEYDLKLFPYLKEIMFEDDTLGAISKHTNEVCDEIIKRKLNKKVSFACNLRVDTKKELIKKLKQAGFRWACVGFEFGTNKSLKAVRKTTTIEQAKEFAKETAKQGLKIHGCFMFGAPGETKEDCRKTIDFAKSLPLDTVQFSGIAVYPGTPLYDWAKQNNYLVPKNWRNWVTEDYKQAGLLDYPQLSTEDINKFIDIGLKEWYGRPKQILRLGFKVLKNKGERKRIIHGFKSWIKLYSFKPKVYKVGGS